MPRRREHQGASQGELNGPVEVEAPRGRRVVPSAACACVSDCVCVCLCVWRARTRACVCACVRERVCEGMRLRLCVRRERDACAQDTESAERGGVQGCLAPFYAMTNQEQAELYVR